MEEKETNSAAGGCEIGTRFEARLACVPAATACLVAGMHAAGADPEAVLRAELILEELVRNTILHGYRGDSAQPLWIAPDANGFCYADAAPPFNPLADGPSASLTAPNPARPVADQHVGGAGLPLIRQLSSSIVYEWVAGCNRLRVAVAAGP
jgi:anti-sigma regulatory factor (Ser/Thr protein kinase)